MVITRSGTATKPIGKKPDKKFLKEKERPSSFEADFAAILNDSEDDEMMNTDVFSRFGFEQFNCSTVKTTYSIVF